MAFIGTDFGISLITGLTETAGSTFLALLVIIIILSVLALGMRIPLEFTAVFILPILLATATVTGQVFPVVGVTLIYLGFLLGKNILQK